MGLFICCRDWLHDQPTQLHHRLQEEEGGRLGCGRRRADGKRTIVKNVWMNLQILTLNEFLELIVPICYLFCYLVAFYGHNSHLVGKIIQIPFAGFLEWKSKDLDFIRPRIQKENISGNAGNSYWHYIGMTEADIPGFVQVSFSISTADDEIDDNGFSKCFHWHTNL